MRLRFTLLLALLGTAFLVFTHAALPTLQEPEQQHTTSRSAEIHDGLGKQLRARLLGQSDVVSRDDEERMGAKEVAGWLSKALKMKAKMKFWLYRGTPPDKVLEKLKVTSSADENYKYYSRYFFKFYAKFPGRQPSNLSAKTADEIMKARMFNWLDGNLTPPQVFKELKLTGTFASARGQPNFKYFEQYSDMWGQRQARLSKAAVRKR